MQAGISKRLHAWLPGLVAFALALIGLEAFVRIFAVSPLILPPPTRVIVEFVTRLPTFPEAMLVTLTETIGGLALGATTAVVLSVLITEISLFRRAIMPLIVAQQVLPIVIFAPILLIWFGYGISSKIIIAAAICFFPIMIALIQGLTTIPPAMIEFARSLGASRGRILRRICLPAALPFFLNALKPGITLASIGAVVGEFLGGNHGLGYLVIESLNYINLPAMFATTIVIILQGLILFWIIEQLNRHFLRWHYLLNRQHK